MRTRQQGAGLLIPVLLVITVAAFAVVVAASQSGTDIQASDANADSLQAMFVAETGIERQLKRFAAGTACTALGDNPGTVPVEATHTITDLSTIGLGTTAYSITLVNGLATDFAGAPLPATQCRVPVTGTVIASNVTRTIHAIVDRNLLEGPDNPTFNNPTTAGAPSGWTLTPATSFANNGGPDGAAPNCSRSAWLAKTNSAGGAVQRSEGQVPVSFTTTGGSTTTITFHWRITDRTGACGIGGAGPAWPAVCAAAGGFEGQVCFRFVGAGTSVANYRNDSTGSVAGVPCPGAVPSTFATCSTGYQPLYPVKQTVTMPMVAGVVNNVFFNMRLQQGGRREMFLDHIEATNPTAIGAAHVKVWRDCSTAPCP
jgi:hypothetical protein